VRASGRASGATGRDLGRRYPLKGAQTSKIRRARLAVCNAVVLAVASPFVKPPVNIRRPATGIFGGTRDL